MINTVIIDGEKEAINKLKGLLDTHCQNNISVSGHACSICEGAGLVLDLKPDLIFLDANVNGGSGHQLIHKLATIQNNQDLDVVFTTEKPEEALQAFKWGAQDYLLKPVGKEGLLTAVYKAEERIHHKKDRAVLDGVLENIKKSINQNKKIAVPTQFGFQVLVVQDILRCEGIENYTNFHLKDGTCILVCKTLKNFEEVLRPCNFFRIHKKNLINLDYVDSYVKGSGGMVVMKDQTELEVSRYRKDEFIKAFSGRMLI